MTARNELRRDLSRIDPKKNKWGMYSLKPTAESGRQQWCAYYVYAKTRVFDDEFAVIGSANCDNSGYDWDTEVVAGIGDDALAVAQGKTFAKEFKNLFMAQAFWCSPFFVKDLDVRPELPAKATYHCDGGPYKWV